MNARVRPAHRIDKYVFCNYCRDEFLGSVTPIDYEEDEDNVFNYFQRSDIGELHAPNINLLKVCRRMYEEALECLMRKRRFTSAMVDDRTIFQYEDTVKKQIDMLGIFIRFLKDIGPKGRETSDILGYHCILQTSLNNIDLGVNEEIT